MKEIQLVEEKHKEEIRLLQIRLTLSERQLSEVQAKCLEHKEYKAQLVQQLHKVMEAQLQEAFKILNNSKNQESLQDDNQSKLDNLKSKSFTNIEEMFTITEQKMKNFKMESHNDDPARSSDFHEDPFTIGDLPTSSKHTTSTQEIESELRRYINMVTS